MAEVYYSEGRLVFRGDLVTSDEPKWLSIVPSNQLVLDFSELDIQEGKALAGLVRWIKDLLSQGYYLDIIEPPQVLVHNLYRVHAYPQANLALINMREDEPYY